MLLDTFTILFEADTSKVKDGLQDSTKQADKLNDELDKADKNAHAAASSIGGAFKAMIGLAAGFLAAGAAGRTFTETVEELNVLGRTAESLGLAVEDVDAFSRSMVAMGGDAQGARDSLVDMAESIGEAVQDAESGRAKVYAGLGISLKDVNGQTITATEGILRLSDAVAGMSKEEAIFRIKELGITDNRTVEMVLKGRKELERMMAAQKENSGVTKEAVENAKKYQEAMNGLKNAQDSITTSMAAAFLPMITKVIDWIAKGVSWLSENKQTAVAFFGAIAAVVATLYLPSMIAAAAATLAATWPIIAIGAAITAAAAAFALIYDDIINFLDGNDSMIGQISEHYPIVGEVVWALANGIKSAFEMAGVAVSAVMSGIVSAVKWAIDFVAGAFKYLSGIMDKIGGAVSTVAGFLGIGGDGVKVEQNVAAGNAAIAQAGASPLNGTTSNAISNSNATTNKETNVQVGQVTVNTQATDAQGISRDVGGSLKDQLGSLDSEFSSGVDR